MVPSIWPSSDRHQDLAANLWTQECGPTHITTAATFQAKAIGRHLENTIRGNYEAATILMDYWLQEQKAQGQKMAQVAAAGLAALFIAAIPAQAADTESLKKKMYVSFPAFRHSLSMNSAFHTHIVSWLGTQCLQCCLLTQIRVTFHFKGCNWLYGAIWDSKYRLATSGISLPLFPTVPRLSRECQVVIFSSIKS